MLSITAAFTDQMAMNMAWSAEQANAWDENGPLHKSTQVDQDDEVRMLIDPFNEISKLAFGMRRGVLSVSMNLDPHSSGFIISVASDPNGDFEGTYYPDRETARV